MNLMNLKKDDDSGESDLFFHIDKSVVLQEARAFNESPVNPRKCRLILTKIVYLLYQSEVFATKEATETFFSITKLFQCPDVPLRQMVYLVIKELSTVAEDVIMVTSSLTKDMTAKADAVYRSNAIRALCKITDASMLQGIERFLKQAIVDKNPSVSSAALVSSLHIFNSSKEVVKRWANEIQEAISSKGIITQYHALGLMYQIRQHDRMAVIKLIKNYVKGALRSPYAHCMLIRYIVKVLEEDDSERNSMYEVLESYLRHKNEMVIYEAARAISGLKNVSSKELYPAVAALQLMLCNHKPTMRFAAVRTMNKIAMTNPTAVSPCNLDMENLITDPNRSIATYAITTLLKTGNEASVDRLMKQITSFMSEISDEFKIIVIDAIRSLCLKFPAKHSSMLSFLANVLRDEGGYEFKRAIVEAIFDIIHCIPESKEYALSHLCEFIEDCEFTKLAVRILHLLGSEGPKTIAPSKCIRYIYNRVILENATVRAAAVCSLARFAVHCDDLRERIRVLLTRCMDDVDDEVRDRASMYLRIIANEELCKKYVANESTYSWAALETNLVRYVQDNSAHQTPFDMKPIPVISKTQALQEKSRAKTAALQEGLLPSSSLQSSLSSSGSRGAAASAKDTQKVQSEAMENIPQLVMLGPVFKSSKPVELTESETEYVVKCIKHIFAGHVVFQYNCRNTLNDQLLEKVNMAVNLESSDDDSASLLQPEYSIPLEKLVYNVLGSIYVVYKRPQGITPSGTFSNVLKFVVKDCDPNTGEPDEEGFEDEYQVEDVDLTAADYVVPTYISEFRKTWEELGAENQVVETYSLTKATSIKAAVIDMIENLGMAPCEGTEEVKDKATTHGLLLAGVFAGGIPCMARCRMAFDPTTGVTLEIGVRSGNLCVSEKIANAIF